MSKRKRVLVMLARGGHSQADVAAIVGCSKRDVSECARFLRESGMGVDELEAMSEADAAAIFAAPPRRRDESHLQVDAPALVERKSRSPRLPLKLMWAEHCEAASAAGKVPYSYSELLKAIEPVIHISARLTLVRRGAGMGDVGGFDGMHCWKG